MADNRSAEIKSNILRTPAVLELCAQNSTVTNQSDEWKLPISMIQCHPWRTKEADMRRQGRGEERTKNKGRREGKRGEDVIAKQKKGKLKKKLATRKHKCNKGKGVLLCMKRGLPRTRRMTLREHHEESD